MLTDGQEQNEIPYLREAHLYLVPGETTNDNLFVVESAFSSSEGLIPTEPPTGWENRKKISPPERHAVS